MLRITLQRAMSREESVGERAVGHLMNVTPRHVICIWSPALLSWQHFVIVLHDV
jgi:hypothetical protein